MKLILSIILFIVVVYAFLFSNGDSITKGATHPPKSNKPHNSVYSSYNGLVMCGYQGWFNAEGDGANRQWYHYNKKGQFKPGFSTIDFWPDISENSITYKTAFKFANGTNAHVYSAYDEASVDLHFKWMQEYGIDGVFMQRFVSEIKNPSGKNHFNTVLRHALKAAKKYGRAISIMYDLSGSSSGEMDIVYNDWIELQQTFKLLDIKQNPTYLWHNDKPLVAIWGVGFNDGRNYSIADTQKLLHTIKGDNTPASVLLGVPYYWRTLRKDTEENPLLHKVIAEADIILPWAVGRYNQNSYHIASDIIKDDIEKCQSLKIDYVPLVFPGFSWGNLKNMPKNYNQIPRQKGNFLWNQIATAKMSGAKMLYVAMFDEVDEGTAIFKCLTEDNLPQNGELKFIGIEKGLENDHYLWLTGQATKWFHGEASFSSEQPKRPAAK